jgi:hypothetical protein
VTPDESTVRAAQAPLAGEPVVAAIVADALAGATPRSAALALLRFDAYLIAVRGAGLDVCPSGALAGALRAELARVCRADGARPGRRSATEER